MERKQTETQTYTNNTKLQVIKRERKQTTTMENNQTKNKNTKQQKLQTIKTGQKTTQPMETTQAKRQKQLTTKKVKIIKTRKDNKTKQWKIHNMKTKHEQQKAEHNQKQERKQTNNRE